MVIKLQVIFEGPLEIAIQNFDFELRKGRKIRKSFKLGS